MSTATLQERRASPSTTTHLVRATVDGRELQRWMTERRITDRDYAMHSLLTESFDQAAPRPYRLVPARDGNEHLLYGYTQGRDAADLKLESAMAADPLQANIIPVDTIQSKTMPTDWPKDKTLGFEARIKPITRMKHLEEPGKNATEIDRYALKVMQGKLPGNEPYTGTRLEAYTEWLQQQFDRFAGAKLHADSTIITNFNITNAIRGPHRGQAKGPDVIMRGTFTITDPDAFRTMLSQGIGRHKAYGFGMLLIHPFR